jgi:hypothetical protein
MTIEWETLGPEDLLAAFAVQDSDAWTFRMERAYLQEGRSFSEEGMDAITSAVVLFIGARIMARWEGTTEPPSMVEVRVEVEVR